MITYMNQGEIWKGSNAEISVMLFPRCYQRKGEITDVSLTFYTTVGGSAITFSGSSVTVSGNSAIVLFQPAQLDVLDDGLLRYQVNLNDNGEPKVFNLETRFVIKTPLDYEPFGAKEIHFVVVDTGDTSQAAIYAEIKSAITNRYFDASKYRFYASFYFEDYNEYIEQEIKIYAWETGNPYRIFFNLLIGNNRSERETQLYSKKWYLYPNGNFYESASIKQDLQYKLTAGTGIEITSANTINCTVTGITSAETQQLIEQAMAAETARTEQTYLKEHQSLADYYTSAQTDSAITTSIETAMTGVVTSSTITAIVTCTQQQYDAMTAHTNNTLYFING